ncbi:Hpt domain-containing protein [Nitratidesulfovibrio sp. SRB-5]|uniref:Hpt domain-containing protein n=1 Tax=Nitratidesulfovibrio sp. SRB-5 TaxID=2872636 RepID=UPI00167E39DD|nr:Hpt domain-containing protein [Nitratidesulfovibrio sp. SRB-5]MBZ2172790.1 Hpt domain-containing protein [Nitratidesulfovibrio sp. SRB-5]
MPDHPVLDRSGAMRRLELDAESYGQLLALMTLEVGGMLDALAEAWRNGDVAAMRQYAHRLKSEAANVGAEEVRFAASRLEQLLRQREGADSGSPPASTTRFSPLEHAGLSGQHVSGQHVSGQPVSGPHMSGAHMSGAHMSGPHMSGAHVLPPGEASAAVSHLRTALARLAAVLGQ